MNRTAMMTHHLQYNHFPPVDASWVPVAEQAIDIAISVAEQYDEGFGMDSSDLDDLLPNGQGKTVREVMDNLHLWDFVTVALQEQDDAMAAEFEFKAGE